MTREEELLALAEALDKARMAANAIEATAPQSDAYGDIETALATVLAHIVGSRSAAGDVIRLLAENGDSLTTTLDYYRGELT